MSGPLVEYRSHDTHTHTPSLRLWAKLCHEKPRYAALHHSAFKARRHEKNWAILTQWHARACRATICCRTPSLSTGRAIHILTRHPCDFEQNCATRSRATPRYATLHSRRGAMRKNGAILTQWHARACRATIRHWIRSLSTGRAMHILTRHPCDCEQNCPTRSRATPRYAALHSGRGAMRKMGLF